MWEESGRLIGDGLPRSAGVEAAIDTRGLVRNPDINGLGRIAGSAGSRIECHPHHSLNISADGTVFALEVCAGVRKVFDLRPTGAVIVAPPESVTTPGPKIEDAVLIGIDRQALAHRAPRHVAPAFEWQIGSFEGIASVSGPIDDAVLVRPFVRIRAALHIEPVRLHR